MVTVFGVPTVAVQPFQHLVNRHLDLAAFLLAERHRPADGVSDTAAGPLPRRSGLSTARYFRNGRR
jgi:hypothetical protein